MTEAQHRSQLFTVLRQALKAHGYTYLKLADELGVSELTIKRLFRDQDCKMSRLIEICSVLGLSLSDLVAIQERLPSSAQFMDVEIEKEIAKQPDLFAFLILLISQVSPQDIAREYQLSDSELYQYLRALEKLEVLEILEGNNIRFCVPLPIRLRFGGVLNKQLKRANLGFLGHCIDNHQNPEYTFTTGGRMMRPSSIAQLQTQVEELQRNYDYLAAQDQMFYQKNELRLYKLVCGIGPFPVMKLFPLEKSYRAL